MRRCVQWALAFTFGVVFASVILQAGTPAPAPRPPFFDPRLMSGDPPLPIPPLSELIGDAATDEDALTAITSYYDRQSLRLAVLFREHDDQRLRALYGMYLVHMTAPYNIVERDWQGESLLDFINGATSACGVYAQAQGRVYTALGLEWRQIEIDGNWHTLIEARINGTWEVFDSTANVWVSVSVEQTLSGAPRVWRGFYSPIFDADAGEAYRDHLQRGFNVPELRGGLPLWGLSVFPRQMEIIDQSAGTRSAVSGL